MWEKREIGSWGKFFLSMHKTCSCSCCCLNCELWRHQNLLNSLDMWINKHLPEFYSFGNNIILQTINKKESHFGILIRYNEFSHLMNRTSRNRLKSLQDKGRTSAGPTVQVTRGLRPRKGWLERVLIWTPARLKQTGVNCVVWLSPNLLKRKDLGQRSSSKAPSTLNSYLRPHYKLLIMTSRHKESKNHS